MSKKFIPVILLFVFIMATVFILQSYLQSVGFNITVLLIGNLILFALSIVGFLIHLRGLKSSNINAFLRGIYASLLLKLFVVAIGVLAYVFVNGKNINKPSLFTCMALYILYTVIEVKQLTKIARKA